MASKKRLISGFGLLLVAFLLGSTLALSLAEPAYACSAGSCRAILTSCPAGTGCEGEPCYGLYNSINEGSGACCGAPYAYMCI